jgi:HK97 family phage portal protein
MSKSLTMRTFLANLFDRLARWLGQSAPGPGRALAGGPIAGSSFLDAYHRRREPTAADLLGELKNTAWTCASLNAGVCASFPPRLFVATHQGQARPRCQTRALSVRDHNWLRTSGHLRANTRAAETIEEVVEHPLLDLLRQVNPILNAFDLWELTTLYQEVTGSAYWLVEADDLGMPIALWILPAQNVRPYRERDSTNLVDGYLYRTGAAEIAFAPEEVIAFRYPDPREPYRAGLSPLRAAYEQVLFTSEWTAFKRSRLENQALPDAILTPDEVIGEAERDRLERAWNQRLRRGGAGRVLVTESALRVQVLSHSLGDLAALADLRISKEEICNAFHVPLSFLTSETNLANLQAAEHQHMAKAILPRVRRRDEKLNERLVPRFDPTGRIFLASDDPVPVNRERTAQEHGLYLKHGVLTINEVRSEQGRAPVPWGHVPHWLEGDPERTRHNDPSSTIEVEQS